MKASIFMMGESIKYNDILIDFIYRNSLKYLQSIDSLYFVEENDKNLFLLLEEVISKNDMLLIYCNDKNFNIIGKILSTIHEDSLVLKNDMLIPSKCSMYDKSGYLIENERGVINVINTKYIDKEPNILLKKVKNIKFINIFEMDVESCKILLDPIAENYEVKIKIIKIIEGWNLVKIESLKYGQINNFIDSSKQLLKNKIIPQKEIISYVARKLIEKEIKISTVESCTGGLLSAKLIRNRGVSSIIKGNLVTYSNETKESWLGVREETLKKYGAVSEECVKEMLEGALNVSTCDISLAISGIAGPTGGSAEKPVGTVYIGAKYKEEDPIIKKLHLKGDRIYIQEQAVLHTVKLLLNLKKEIFFSN